MERILIFGAGLAGTCLAHQFLRRGREVLLVDAGENHSSSIAAGMVNPMVFRRMNKSWRLDEFMPDAQAFYQEISQEIGEDLFHPIVIRRFFSSEQERQLWSERQEMTEYKAYLNPISSEDLSHAGAHNTFGSGRIKNAFWIDAEKWVAQNMAYFEQRGMLLREAFDPESWQAAHKTYRNCTYDKVIFCLGYQQKSEGTFSYLPLQQTKGQTLLIKSSDILEKESLNRKCFVLPLGHQQFRVGATYEWNNDSLDTTDEARSQLIEMLASLGSYNYEILEQKAGVRPTVLDRRPLIGEHPFYQGVFIFNGLGTKGYMMAPTLAKELVAHILDQTPLHPETEIKRFTAI
ncbi:MAG: NAD(P)/FAD-dependent oxidoreductase [Flavobacteriales bacterium]